MYTPYFDAYTPPYIRLSWRTSVGHLAPEDSREGPPEDSTKLPPSARHVVTPGSTPLEYPPGATPGSHPRDLPPEATPGSHPRKPSPEASPGAPLGSHLRAFLGEYIYSV